MSGGQPNSANPSGAPPAESSPPQHQVDSITEGIGINNRLTANFAAAQVDAAFRGSDREAVEMAAYLMRNEGTRALPDWKSVATGARSRPAATWPAPRRTCATGIFVGSSSAMNCVGAVKAARRLGPGHTIVTVLCDSGQRHLTKFWSPAVLERWNLTPTATGTDLDWIEDVV